MLLLSNNSYTPYQLTSDRQKQITTELQISEYGFVNVVFPKEDFCLATPAFVSNYCTVLVYFLPGKKFNSVRFL